MTTLLHERLAEEVIGAAMEVHRELGPGLLESAYEECLCYELSQRGLPFRRQVAVPLKYKAIRLDCGCVIDVIVADVVLLELKAVETVPPVFLAQLLTYLRLAKLKVGLLINFHVPVLKDGIVRRVL